MSLNDAHHKVIELIQKKLIPVALDTPSWIASLLDKIGDSRYVLIGEASHGTEEFYRRRIELSQALIQKKGFMAIAIEGDWPDAYTIHRYMQGFGHPEDHLQALEQFTRFPTWMWRNVPMSEFISWARNYNQAVPFEREKIGFYGLDLYSMGASMHRVIDYLRRVDPHAAERAIERYGCFDHTCLDPQMYGFLINTGVRQNCIQEAMDQLLDMQHHAEEYLKHDGLTAEEDYFFATQNARLVKNAEHYYRTMLSHHVNSWNIRDRHMAETLDILIDHLENRWQRPAKIIVWAHNSHVGDARATEMGEQGEINIGQVLRETHEHVFSLGFSTYQGTVRAASHWDGPSEVKTIVPGLIGSYEALFHEVNAPNFLLHVAHDVELEHYLQYPRLQRAIGVVYCPETERQSHYFLTRLPYQFDSIIHLDHTSALHDIKSST